MNDAVHVAVAVIRNPEGQIFITYRPDHVHQGGLWEFPGGKLEPGESVQQALRREIHEENGIVVEQIQPLIKIPYQYPDKHVLLDVWEVLSYQGDAHGREGQPFRWVAPGDLSHYDFPAANHSIITAVQLPAYYLITPEPDENTNLFLDQLENRLQAGIKLVQFRAKTIRQDSFITLAKAIISLCHRYNAKVLLNSSPELFSKLSTLNADGIHLTSQRLMALTERPVPVNKLFAASCHSEKEITQANIAGADFVVLGPVQATTSHPNNPIIGWDKFDQLTEQALMPVFALGGMSIDDVDRSRECGGQGIAAISSLWHDC